MGRSLERGDILANTEFTVDKDQLFENGLGAFGLAAAGTKIKIKELLKGRNGEDGVLFEFSDGESEGLTIYLPLQNVGSITVS